MARKYIIAAITIINITIATKSPLKLLFSLFLRVKCCRDSLFPLRSLSGIFNGMLLIVLISTTSMIFLF